MPTASRPYLSYLLRLWRMEDGDQPQWRAALEDPRTGQQIGFASLEALFIFLRKETLKQAPDCNHSDQEPERW